MKQSLPYTVLLVLAAAFSVLLVVYNFALRESFPVMVQYALPATELPQPESAADSPPEADAVLQEAKAYTEQPVEETQEPPPVRQVRFPLDLNTASIGELELVPKIGNITAQRIVQYREVLGAYTALEQLMEIKGIGEQTFASISPYVYIPQTEEISVQEEPPQEP